MRTIAIMVTALLAACRATATPASDTNDGGSIAQAEAADAQVACGVDTTFAMKCCPRAWVGGGPCVPGPTDQDNRCWTTCLPAPGLADGGYPGVNGQLFCGGSSAADGVVSAGKGLFPCTPNQ